MRLWAKRAESRPRLFGHQHKGGSKGSGFASEACTGARRRLGAGRLTGPRGEGYLGRASRRASSLLLALRPEWRRNPGANNPPSRAWRQVRFLACSASRLPFSPHTPPALTIDRFSAAFVVSGSLMGRSKREVGEAESTCGAHRRNTHCLTAPLVAATRSGGRGLRSRAGLPGPPQAWSITRSVVARSGSAGSRSSAASANCASAIVSPRRSGSSRRGRKIGDASFEEPPPLGNDQREFPAP